MKRAYRILVFLLLTWLNFSCNNEENRMLLKNSCLYRTYGPNIVGEEILLAYAMAIPSEAGKLVSAQVVASIAGGVSTYIDPNSYHTDNAGNNVGILVAEADRYEGTLTSVNFIVDTCAATLHYHYDIPQEARGKTVSFKFSAIASNGESISYDMGPYNICKMDMFRNISISNDSYISLHGDDGVTVYTKAEMPNATKDIDLLYSYRTISQQIALKHSFFASDSAFLSRFTPYFDDVLLPINQLKTKLRIAPEEIRDQQLTSLQYGVYVDDLDFKELNMSAAGNGLINVLREEGFWVETADGEYRAYIFVNSITTGGGATISIKRYKVN